MGDLAAFHRILSDPQATAFWSTLPHASLDQSREWLRAMVDIPEGEGEDFAVEHQGRVIGKAGLFRFPEIGFIFDPTVWGLGLAAEALRAVLHRAFEVHRLGIVVADVDCRNTRSLKLLKRIGFREVGRRERSWRIGDLWCDSVDLHLNRADLDAARGHEQHA